MEVSFSHLFFFFYQTKKILTSFKNGNKMLLLGLNCSFLQIKISPFLSQIFGAAVISTCVGYISISHNIGEIKKYLQISQILEETLLYVEPPRKDLGHLRFEQTKQKIFNWQTATKAKTRLALKSWKPTFLFFEWYFMATFFKLWTLMLA